MAHQVGDQRDQEEEHPHRRPDELGQVLGPPPFLAAHGHRVVVVWVDVVGVARVHDVNVDVDVDVVHGVRCDFSPLEPEPDEVDRLL